MKPSYDVLFEKHRDALINGPALFNLDEAWALPWDKIADYQIFKGVAIRDDEWVVPKDFVNENYYSACYRTIDFVKALPDGWSQDDPKAESLIRRLKRFAFLNFTQTIVFNRKKSTPIKPRTWVHHTRNLINAARFAMTLSDRLPFNETTCPDSGIIFGNLSPEDFDELCTKHPNLITHCGPRLNGLYNAGLFDDWPAGDIETVQPGTRKPIQPFSDGAFTEILQAAHFLAKIQTDLEACYAEIAVIDCDEQGRRHFQRRVIPYRNQQIAQWQGNVLHPGFAFPYIFEVTGEKRTKKEFTSWPVDTLDGVKSLLWLCQVANAIILNTATGGRISEMKTLDRDPLVALNGEEYLTGYTFKESANVTGSERHWPLPELAVEAVRKQKSLHETLGYQGDKLWVPGGNSTTGIASLDVILPTFGRSVKTLDGEPLGEIDNNISSHRFRKTMARLIGLCLEGASEVLYTVLGHNNIEVTMGYMLSSPKFASDADIVRREVQHVRRKKLIGEIDDCGGLAANTIRTTKKNMTEIAIKHGISPDASEILKAILPTIIKIKENTYCTTALNENGLCSMGKEIRDIGACPANCIYRLEAAAEAQNKERLVEAAMQMMRGNRVSDGRKAMFQTQIIAGLATFEKTLDVFTSDERLRGALWDCDHRHFNGLPQQTKDKLIDYLESK